MTIIIQRYIIYNNFKFSTYQILTLWGFGVLSFWVIFGWFSRANFCFFLLLGVKNSKTEKFHKIWKICLFKTKKLHFWKFLVFDSLTPKSLKNKNLLRKISQKWPKRSKSKKSKKRPQKHQNYTIFLAFWNFSDFGSFLPKNGKNCDF